MKKQKKLIGRIFALCMMIVTLGAFVLTVPISASDSSGGALYTPDNLSNQAHIGTPLFLSLYEEIDDTRWYYCALVGSVPDHFSIDAEFKFVGWSWDDLDGNGFYSDLTYIFRKDFGDGYDTYYDPVTEQYYNELEYRISIENWGRQQFDEKDICINTVCWENTDIQGNMTDYYQNYALSINVKGDYTIHQRLYFIEYGNRSSRILERVQNIVISDCVSEADDYYNMGYSSGYDKGVKSGEQQAWSFYEFMNTLTKAPITFIKEAFNFEIFGINLSNFFLFICSASLVIFAVVVILRFIV